MLIVDSFSSSASNKHLAFSSGASYLVWFAGWPYTECKQSSRKLVFATFDEKCVILFSASQSFSAYFFPFDISSSFHLFYLSSSSSRQLFPPPFFCVVVVSPKLAVICQSLISLKVKFDAFFPLFSPRFLSLAHFYFVFFSFLPREHEISSRIPPPPFFCSLNLALYCHIRVFVCVDFCCYYSSRKLAS